MTSTQVSFSAFAASVRDQQCLLCGELVAACKCTPPASTSVVPALVAQDGSGGECSLRLRRERLLYARRYSLQPRYVVVGHYSTGPEVYRICRRAKALNLARSCGFTFVDLGAAA